MGEPLRPKPDVSHLHPASRPIALLSDAERIAHIRADRWIGYTRAQKALAKLEDLFTQPQRQRMANLLLIGPTNNGKSMIIEKFRRAHQLEPAEHAAYETIPLLLVVSISAVLITVLVVFAVVIGSQQPAPVPSAPALTSAGLTMTAASSSLTAQANQPVSNSQPTSVPTTQPTTTTAPTSQSTTQSVINPTSGPALLGSDLGTFAAIYGQPNDHSTPSVGEYHFKRYPGSNIDFLILWTDNADGGVYANRVENVNVQASDAGADAGWTQAEADASCAPFLPRDAVYKSQVGLTGGYDKIYFSASLASLFPASAFTDGNSNQVQSGLFDVQYLYASGSLIAGCSILIGTQQMQ